MHSSWQQMAVAFRQNFQWNKHTCSQCPLFKKEAIILSPCWSFGTVSVDTLEQLLAMCWLCLAAMAAVLTVVATTHVFWDYYACLRTKQGVPKALVGLFGTLKILYVWIEADVGRRSRQLTCLICSLPNCFGMPYAPKCTRGSPVWYPVTR